MDDKTQTPWPSLPLWPLLDPSHPHSPHCQDTFLFPILGRLGTFCFFHLKCYPSITSRGASSSPLQNVSDHLSKVPLPPAIFYFPLSYPSLPETILFIHHSYCLDPSRTMHSRRTPWLIALSQVPECIN